jgi:hypothetical protein
MRGLVLLDVEEGVSQPIQDHKLLTNQSQNSEGWDAGWSLMNATQAEIMPAYVGKKKTWVPDDGRRDQEKTTAYSE